jgi:hypothetical protein
MLFIDSIRETIVSFWQLTSAFFFDKLASSRMAPKTALNGQKLASFLLNRGQSPTGGPSSGGWKARIRVVIELGRPRKT